MTAIGIASLLEGGRPRMCPPEPWELDGRPVSIRVLVGEREILRETHTVVAPRPSAAPRIELAVPATIDGPTLTITGTITSETASVRISVSSGGEETTWEAAAGPFASVVTLSQVGDNEVTVRVRDARGHTSTATRTVRRYTSSVTSAELEALDGQ
jgi:hypothetical protein